MKKPKYSYRNKLINSTIMLIVATLVLSSAQGAFVSDTNNVLTVPDLVSAHPAEMNAASAVNPPADTRVDFLGYDDGTTENAYAWTSGDPWQCAIQLTDTQLTGYRDYEITEVMFSCGSDSYGFYIADYEIWISDQLEDPTAPPQVYATGTSSGTGWDTVTLDMAYDIPDTGDVYVGISYSNYGGNWPAGVDDSQSVPEGDWLYYSGTWQHLGDLVGYLYVWGLDAGVTPGGGPPPVDTYVKLGDTADLSAIVENTGTFDENDLTCWADLYSYNETGAPTLVYEANITDIDLDPLGDEEALDFGQWTFDIEGPYGFFLDLPLGVDDFPGNNEADIGIGVDGSIPTADHSIDPASATGSNGWWVDPVEVTLTAEDVDGLYNSGISVIQYQIDGGATQTYTAPFTVSDDGEHTVEYWAIDNVGYESTHGTVSFKIDMTPPTIDLTWEAGDAKNEVVFTATCSDATSDMDKVEFFINDVLQFTGSSAPYTWTMVHGAGTKYTVKAVAYDMAGLTDFDEIGSGEGLITINVNTVPNPLIK
jgi:hypothetical protein